MNPGTWKISDNEIASEVISAFKWNWQIPSKRVKVSIEDGWLTLEGDAPVECSFYVPETGG